MRYFKFSFVVAVLLAGVLFIQLFTMKGCQECYEPDAMAVKAIASGLLIMIGAILSALQYAKVESSMTALEALPLLEPHEATDGVVFAGEADIEPRNGVLLKSPYTGTECVYFHSIFEERVMHEKYARWVIISNMSASVPFLLKDRLGNLEVDLTNVDTDFSSYKIHGRNTRIPDPKHSEIDATAILKHALTIPIKPDIDVLKLGYNKRYSEFVLLPYIKVFAHGMVTKRDGQHVLHEDENTRLIISTKTRDQYVESFYLGNYYIYALHGFIAGGYSIILSAADYYLQMNALPLYTLLIFGNMLILGSIIFTMYNRIITLFTRTENALADIESELKRRQDLIPNLVEVMKAYTKHEMDTHKITTSLRAELSFTPHEPEKVPPLSTAAHALSEQYPKLKANALFRQLMQKLVDTEERIAYSREYYNRTIRKYNTLINQYPFLIIAWFFSFESGSYLQIEQGKK